MYHEHTGQSSEGRDRREVATHVVTDVLVDEGIDHMRARYHPQAIAIGLRPRHLGGTDRAARTRLVLHYDRLAQRIGETGREQSADGIGRPPCAIRDDEPNGTVGPCRRWILGIGPRCGKQAASGKDHASACGIGGVHGSCLPSLKML